MCFLIEDFTLSETEKLNNYIYFSYRACYNGCVNF